MHEKVYYIGVNDVWDDGDRLVHGELGEVMGPGDYDEELSIKFPNNRDAIDLKVRNLSYSPPPPLPGGFSIGEKLYYTGGNYFFDNGDRLLPHEQGEVMGPSTSVEGQLMLKFPKNKRTVKCRVDELSRYPSNNSATSRLRQKLEKRKDQRGGDGKGGKEGDENGG